MYINPIKSLLKPTYEIPLSSPRTTVVGQVLDSLNILPKNIKARLGLKYSINILFACAIAFLSNL